MCKAIPGEALAYPLIVLTGKGVTINVVVDGVTPSTGVTGTAGVSVDKKV